MSKLEKRLLRFLNNPNDAKWDHVVILLRIIGFTVKEPNSGSHWIVEYPGKGWHESIPVHSNRTKPVYYKKLRRRIEECLQSYKETEDENDEDE
ncbi:hypothetical protein [Desulfurispora thermophila]|uniref:hypothetical protein n=1 Tax=Desulfurispora thermophila TaxID=265470 RepID=UPI00039E56C1|nr:hypothetical protein [Desulfurispora thermophila]